MVDFNHQIFLKDIFFLRHKNLCKNIPGVTSFCCSSSSSFRGDENLRAILFDKIDFLTHTIKIKFYYVAFYFTVSDFEVLIFFLISVASVSQSAQPSISFCFVLNFDASATAADNDEMGPARLFRHYHIISWIKFIVLTVKSRVLICVPLKKYFWLKYPS